MRGASRSEQRTKEPTRRRASSWVFLLSAAFLLAGLLAPGHVEARQSQPAAVVSGRVVDAETQVGVEGAEVRLLRPRRSVVTDADGRFRFNVVPAGQRIIQVQRLGYQDRTDTLDVPDAVELDLTLAVSVRPVPLPGLVVDTRSLLLLDRGFYDRKSQGFRGTFLDRRAIEKKDPLYVSDLFRGIPGVEVVNDSRLIMNQSVNFYDGGRGCEPGLWLDGIRSGLRNYDYIRPDHIEGIEVYTGGGGPGKFNDLCGTVVIWTRVPIRR